MSQMKIHTEAEIEYLSLEQGGRGIVFSGYRGQFHYNNHGWDAIQNFDVDGPIPTGRTLRAYLTFLSPEAHRNKLRPGKEFEIREGSKVVGRGHITKNYLDK